jgi:hypothetical protein
MISEVSVNDHLAPSLWGHSKAETLWVKGMVEKRCSYHGSQDAKKGQKGSSDKVSSKAWRKICTSSNQTRLLKFPPPSRIVPSAGNQAVFKPNSYLGEILVFVF